MANIDTSSTDCYNLNSDVLDEIEALKAIFEDQMTCCIAENGVDVTFVDEKISIHFYIDGNYPCVGPNVKVTDCVADPSSLVQMIEKLIEDNIGSLMLYDLISTAVDFLSNIPISLTPLQPEIDDKPLCKFYLKGSCRFGEKCFNSHGDKETDYNQKNLTADGEVEQPGVKVENRASSDQDNIAIRHLVLPGAQRESYEDDSNIGIKKKRGKGTPEKKTKGPNKHGETAIRESKKPPMKTAIDVIHRIMWDEAFPTENFIVGYLDRFTGIQEKLFSEFSWEDISSVDDYEVLAIPKHRIQYFKYKNVVVWDKTKRLDKVFGSTGDVADIIDVINDDSIVMEKMKNEEEVVDVVHYDNSTRPNYFICLRITDSKVRKNIKKVQDGITYYDERLKATNLAPNVYHVTLVTLRLNNEADFIKAGEVMRQLQNIFICMFNDLETSYLTFTGINDFRGQVVIAEVAPCQLFHKFVEITKMKLKDAGIPLVGNHEPFAPHITLMKLNRPFQRETNMETINNLYYTEFKECALGTQPLDAIRLCSTSEERGEDGFYVTLATISSNLFNIHTKLPSLIGNFVQDLMGAGLVLENIGDELLTEILSDDADTFREALGRLNGMLNPWPSFYTRRRKHVIVVRGLPGSGKSFFVGKIKASCDKNNVSFAICSSDHYFHNQNSEYKHSNEDIALAHAKCRNEFMDAMCKNCEVIMVDNTHVMKWEYQIYQRIARLCGYTSHVVCMNCVDGNARNRFFERCQHKMESYVHIEMANRWETDDEAVLIDSDGYPSVDINELLNHGGSILPLVGSSVLYSALYLDKESQQVLLSCYPAIHERVSCDHVTLMYEPGVPDLESVGIGMQKSVTVIGYILNNNIQAVLVENVAGETCSTGKPHITISTNRTTPPKDVQLWIDNQPSIPPKCELVLTGTVGVQVATSAASSTKCINSLQFSAILSSLKTKYSCTQMEIEEKADTDEEGEDNDAGLYFGPSAVKSLFVFDFDGTLFHTPDPVEGRKDYARITGKKWPHRGWLGNTESLQFPLLVYPGPSLNDYFNHCGRACSMCVLLTGRIERVRDGLENILRTRGLSGFDKIILKPIAREAPNVDAYKTNVVRDLMKEHEHLEIVKFYDDREDNITRINGLGKIIRSIDVQTIHVDAATPNFNGMTLLELMDRMGLLQSAEFRAGVQSGIQFISNMCKDVFELSDKRDILCPFGSYLLQRRGDVDLCLLVPKHLNVDQCVRKLGSKALDYGVQHVYVASGNRVPLVKMRLNFLNTPPIDFDIVVAAVLDKDDRSENFDFDLLHKTSSHKSKAALDGLVFFEKVVVPVLDRLDVAEFGAIINILNYIVKKNNLKGNVFHCIRTFHLVHLLAEFIHSSPPDLIPGEGLSHFRDCEHFVQLLLRFIGSKPELSFKKLFNGFVPDMYIEPLKQCFLEGSHQGLLEMLYTAPYSSATSPNFKVEVLCTAEPLRWRGFCLVEARLGMTLYNLIKEQGVTVHPLSSPLDPYTLIFDAKPFSIVKNALVKLKKELDNSTQLSNDVVVKLYCENGD